MAEGRRVHSGCDLWIVKVYNYKITYNKRMRSVCDNKK